MSQIHQNESYTFCKLFLLKWLFLRLQMSRVPLKKGDFYETHTAYWLAPIRSTCSSNLQSELKLPTQTHQMHHLA